VARRLKRSLAWANPFWPAPKAGHQVDAERLYAGIALSAVTAIIFATTNTRLTAVRPGA